MENTPNVILLMHLLHNMA